MIIHHLHNPTLISEMLLLAEHIELNSVNEISPPNPLISVGCSDEVTAFGVIGDNALEGGVLVSTDKLLNAVDGFVVVAIGVIVCVNTPTIGIKFCC